MDDHNPALDLSDLSVLEKSRGWQLYCALHGKRLTALTNAMLDLKTSAETAEHIRQARAVIENEFGPAKMLQFLLNKNRTEAEKISRELSGQAPK